MGISTLASYRNSMLFETVGLDPELCAEFFEDAACVLRGKGLVQLLQESLERHASAFAPAGRELHDAGLYRFRINGERRASAQERVRRVHPHVTSGAADDARAC